MHKTHVRWPANATKFFYTATRQKNIQLQTQVNFGKLRFSKTVRAWCTTSLQLQCREKEGHEKGVICFTTPRGPTLASSRMQSLSCVSMWGDGCPYKFMVGGNGSPYSRCPPNWVFCSLPPCLQQQLPPLPFHSFFFLSEGVHFETHPLWRLKGPTSKGVARGPLAHTVGSAQSAAH